MVHASAVCMSRYEAHGTVWRAFKRLDLQLSPVPGETRTPLPCSPNFPCASYLDTRKLTHEPIIILKLGAGLSIFFINIVIYLFIQEHLV